MMRSMRTAAQPVSGTSNGNGKFDPSTWANQARQLARQDADANALLWGVILAIGTALAATVAVAVDGATWRDVLSAEMAAALGVQIVAIGIIWLATYAMTLRNDTREVRMATWRQELARNEDLDNDGQIGPPQPMGHVVRIGGSKPASVVLPDLDTGRSAPNLARFPVTANDVIYVLTRAVSNGLGFRDWDGHRLPSGKVVDRPLWASVIDGMVDWEMVYAMTDAAGRRRVRLASDVTVDEMIDAVRRSVSGAQP